MTTNEWKDNKGLKNRGGVLGDCIGGAGFWGISGLARGRGKFLIMFTVRQQNRCLEFQGSKAEALVHSVKFDVLIPISYFIVGLR